MQKAKKNIYEISQHCDTSGFVVLNLDYERNNMVCLVSLSKLDYERHYANSIHKQIVYLDPLY